MNLRKIKLINDYLFKYNLNINNIYTIRSGLRYSGFYRNIENKNMFTKYEKLFLINDENIGLDILLEIKIFKPLFIIRKKINDKMHNMILVKQLYNKKLVFVEITDIIKD